MTTSQSPTPVVPMGDEARSYWAKKGLERLRETLNADAIIGNTVRVVLYVKTLPGEDPTPHFKQLRAKAVGRGWRVHSEIHDDTGKVQPADSPAWNDLMQTLIGGTAQGVLAPTFQHISLDHACYRDALYAIAEHRCFTSLLIPEPST